MKTGKIIIIDVLDDPPFNITEIFKASLKSVNIDDHLIVGINGLGNDLSMLPKMNMLGAIISGSIHHVIEDGEKEWGKSLFHFIRQYYNCIPILGVCYGHQALAHALGGDVRANERGREIGSVQIFLTEDARTDKLFCDSVDGGFVQESHLDHVVSLPKGAIILAHNQHSPIQAFRVGKSWGIQFHPELSPPMFRQLLKGRIKRLIADNEHNEAKKLERVMAGIRDCPMAVEILRKFILHCKEEKKYV
ncbi:MAG: gamma-glutamyl-gamma-aminobutyrate hydrolase family protein [Parcubacteria group bacterium]|jgi:GMP synthase (glutamine-hydrolysing)